LNGPTNLSGEYPRHWLRERKALGYIALSDLNGARSPYACSLRQDEHLFMLDAEKNSLHPLATASASCRLVQTASRRTGMRRILYFAAATALASTLAMAQAQQSPQQQSPNQPGQKQTTQMPSKNQTTRQRSGRNEINRDRTRNRTASRTTVKGRTGMRHARAYRGSRIYAYRSGRRHTRMMHGPRTAYGYRHHRMRYARHGGRAYGYRAYGRRYRGCD
jgi:hypothetical protein